jgi:hypothetical protein
VTEFTSIASFKVAGRLVNASSARFEQGVAADLAVGRRVEVDGVLVDNVLLATRVEFKASAPAGEVSVEGAIADFVSVANFHVAGQWIDATSAVFRGGIASDLANGRRVEVGGTLSGAVLVASTVTIEDAPSAHALEVEGAIKSFVSITNFQVAGQTVNASQATFTGGTSADLVNGRRIGARGTVVAGVLVAAKIEIKDATQGVEASVKGAISSFVSSSNFVVAGRTVDASAAAFEHGSASTLANGLRVEVEGVLDGAVLRAKHVSFE